MRILILSDVHGNLPSLEYVLKSEKSADLVISLGDVVNYGPWGNECVDLLDSLRDKVLLTGNHEEAFLKGVYTGRNIIAQTFFDECFPVFDRKEKISSYIHKFSFGNSDFIHTINNGYIFSDTEVKIKKYFFRALP